MQMLVVVVVVVVARVSNNHKVTTTTTIIIITTMNLSPLRCEPNSRSPWNTPGPVSHANDFGSAPVIGALCEGKQQQQQQQH
jgi:hypothetical protein